MATNKKFKILFVTSELAPFVKTGGVADVSSALPQKLLELGHQVRIVLPKYGAIDERRFKIHEVVRLKDLKTEVNGEEIEFSMRSSFLVGTRARVQIYFLDNKHYFSGRHSIYADPKTGEYYDDNDERFILLAKSVFKLIDELGWVPDIIHCNDWQTALVPAYLKTIYKDNELLKNIKTVFTIHNLGYQGIFPKSSFEKSELPKELDSEKGVIHKKKFNFMKVGIKFADVITTVSETYAKDICTKEFGEGLESVICEREKDLVGILNGIDSRVWNPEKDKFIPMKYSIKSLKDKAINKIALMEKFGFEADTNTPVIGIISRLSTGKGFDLIKKAFKKMMKLDAKFVLLGTGEMKYVEFFEEAMVKYKKNFGCYLGFDEQLAHLIEAGSDMFLMPSKYEPCGLNQMYSLAYGTIPIVRRTGGLQDTVRDYSEGKNGNGFVFDEYDADAMLKAIERAIELFKTDKKTWKKLMTAGMKSDYTWLKSAKRYINLYAKIS
jgi:starch synthase